MARIEPSAEAEEHRDAHWQREETRRVETAFDVERFVDRTGFASCLTDARRPGASLYVAVCGRRDAVMPRNVQKDPEASHTWFLKDEVVRRGNVYYGKLTGARTNHGASAGRRSGSCMCSGANGRWRRRTCERMRA